MSAPKKIFALLWFAVALLVRAEDEEPRRNPLLNPPVALAFAPHDASRPGGVAIHYLFLTAPYARNVSMAVQRPDGYTIEYDQRLAIVRFIREDKTGWLTLRLINTGSAAPMLDQETTQQWILRQHPKTKLIKAAPANAGAFPGFSYDLLWPAPGGVNQRQRALYAPVPGGILELTANATPEAFTKLEQDFDSLAFCFRHCPAGKRDLVPPACDSN
ncbi:MAG: hypothetical protein RL380_239 [Verrucomicrobiota bacterium]|jgi:hypothetical protein